MKRAITPKITAALAALLSLGVIASGAPATANAAEMLMESEPNDTVLEADGPIPAAGYLATRSTSNDVDKFILRLQPQRQVTLTMQRVSGCYRSTSFYLTRSDAYEQVSFFGWTDGVTTESWTTPVVATEYIGQLGSDFSTGYPCTVSVVVSPADAVIEGPLPARPARDATIAPVDAVADKDFTATVTGNAYSGDKLTTWSTTSPSCSSTPSDAVETLVPAGPFSVPVTVPGESAGVVNVCSALRNPNYTLIPSIVVTRPVAIRAPNPLTVESRKVRLSKKRKANMAVKCHLPSGEMCASNLTITTKTGKAVATISTAVASGQTKKATFKVSRKIARKAAKAGVLRLRVTGTVTRAGFAAIQVQNDRLLLVPAARR